MPQPITWRNVDSPGLGVPGQSLLGAQQSINGAFDVFQNVLAQRQQLDNNNAAVIQNNGRQAFLDALEAAKTPEELAALRASGQLDTLRSGMDAASRAAVRGAEDRRLTGLRQDTLATQEYGASQRALREAPIRDQVGVLIAQGKVDEANALMATSGISNVAPLAQAATTAARNKILQARTDKQAADEEVTRTLKLDEARYTAAETDRQRTQTTLANNLISAARAANIERQKKYEPALQAFDKERFVDANGDEMKVPRNQDGSPNYAAMGAGMRTQLNDFLKNWQGSDMTVNGLEGSDTAARKRITDELYGAGATPADIARLEPILSAGLNSTAAPLQGNDLAKAERKQRTQEELVKEARGQFVPMSDPAAADEVYAAGAKAIKDKFGADSMKAREWISTLDSVLKNGIVATDEKGNAIAGANGPIKVIPSASTMLRLIDTAPLNHVIGRYGNLDFQDHLRNWVKDGKVYRNAGRAVEAGLLEAARNIDPIKAK